MLTYHSTQHDAEDYGGYHLEAWHEWNDVNPEHGGSRTVTMGSPLHAQEPSKGLLWSIGIVSIDNPSAWDTILNLQSSILNVVNIDIGIILERLVIQEMQGILQRPTNASHKYLQNKSRFLDRNIQFISSIIFIFLLGSNLSTTTLYAECSDLVKNSNLSSFPLMHLSQTCSSPWNFHLLLKAIWAVHWE